MCVGFPSEQGLNRSGGSAEAGGPCMVIWGGGGGGGRELRLTNSIMGSGRMGTPSVNRLTDTHTRLKQYLSTTLLAGGENWSNMFYKPIIVGASPP